jgi:hypothetical protein
MNHNGAGPQNSPTRAGYLIKVRFIGGQKSGFDVYKVPRGKTAADAMANTGGVEHWVYTTPSQVDVIIEVTAADLGMVGFWT